MEIAGSNPAITAMNLDELDQMIEAQRERFRKRAEDSVAITKAQAVIYGMCMHRFSCFYQSSSGRKVCTKCGYVTDRPDLAPIDWY